MWFWRFLENKIDIIFENEIEKGNGYSFCIFYFSKCYREILDILIFIYFVLNENVNGFNIEKRKEILKRKILKFFFKILVVLRFYYCNDVDEIKKKEWFWKKYEKRYNFYIKLII